LRDGDDGRDDGRDDGDGGAAREVVGSSFRADGAASSVLLVRIDERLLRSLVGDCEPVGRRGDAGRRGDGDAPRLLDA